MRTQKSQRGVLLASRYSQRSVSHEHARGSSKRPSEPPNLYFLSSPKSVLTIYFPVFPTASRVMRLVQPSKLRPEDLVQQIHERIARKSRSRWLRDPDFSEENRRMQFEINTLKNRLYLFLTVM